MHGTPRRFWPVLAVALAAILVLTVRLAVDYVTRDEAYYGPVPKYSRIENSLWLGGFVTEPPPGCKSVLNLCESEDPYQVESHRWEPISDGAPAPSLDWLRKQVDFIESEQAKGHAVYVHCFAGVSRSGMVSAAYLMRREKWSRDQALDYLRSRRPGVRPNPAFMQLLSQWEQMLKK